MTAPRNPFQFRDAWDRASPGARWLTIALIVATVLIVVFFIAPMIREVFNAGHGGKVTG